MFRKRLGIALAVLAAVAVLEGAIAVWALSNTERLVVRGRVASDIQLGFAELAADKQRLRGWVAQRQHDAGADEAERARLLERMQATLTQLEGLSQRALTLSDDAAARAEFQRRADTVQVLRVHVDEVSRSAAEVQPLAAGTDARAAWQALVERFDVSNGRDMRRLLADSAAAEAMGVQRKRADADAALARTRLLWLAVACTLAAASLLLAAHFARALRRPLGALEAGAQALQRGELSHRIAWAGADEFAAVARSMNSMAAELAEHRAREVQARLRLEEQVQARTDELQQALDALQQVDARRRRLFADISHELRTPTTVIRGEAEIALRGGRDRAPEEYRATLSRIVDTSRQLGLVIDDLLTMARSDIDALSLRRQPLDLSVVLAEALAQAEALAHERDVQLRLEPVPAGAWPLMGDPQRLRQLLMVLLDNAVRYSRPGGVVRVQVQHLPGRPPCCEVRVSDDGIGIAPDELPQVFERNFRGIEARRHRADGSGLGLAIGRSLARALGGDIELASEPGQGTTASLHLPLRDDTAHPVAVAA